MTGMQSKMIFVTVLLSLSSIFAFSYQDISQVQKIELIRTIGDIESADENYMFYLPSDIAADMNGNIYILDSGNHRIQKFDPEGIFVRTFGVEGQGPGEFRYPSSLDIDKSGNLYISDQGNYRIQMLDKDGCSITTIRREAGTGGLRILEDNKILIGRVSGIMGQIAGGSAFRDNSAGIINREGNILTRFSTSVDFKDLMMNRLGNEVHISNGPDGSIYLCYAYQNRIEKYSQTGRLLFTTSRTLNFDSTLPIAQGTEDIKEMIRVNEPEMNLCSNGISVDRKNRMWIITPLRQMKDCERVQTNMNIRRDSSGNKAFSFSVSGETGIKITDMFCLEVFDDMGKVSFRIRLKHFADGIRILGDKLYILDRFRGMQYYEYKIIEQL